MWDRVKHIKFSQKTIFILIFLLFAAVHFINLDKRIVFGWDQEQFSFQIKNIITKGDYTLLGPRVNNDRGFFLAPYFTYLLVPFYFLSNLHPSVLIFFVILVNLAFFFLSLSVIKRFFNEKIAFLFLILWSLNSLLQAYDSNAWWPLLVPLGVMVTWHLLWEIYHSPRSLVNWILLGAEAGFFMNMHFQFIFIVIFIAIFLFLGIRAGKIPALYTIIPLVVFLFSFAPLVLFDLRHEFLNTKLFLNFFFSSDVAQKKDLTVWLDVFGNFLRPYIFIRSYYLAAPILAFLIFIILRLRQKSKDFLLHFYTAYVFILVVTAIFFTVYGQRPSEYYFLYLAPFIILTIAQLVNTYQNNKYLRLYLVFIFLFNGFYIVQNLSGYQDGLYYKNQVAAEVKRNFDGKRFNIAYDGPPGSDNGFRYLLEWHGVTQTGDTTDPLIQICRPPKKNDIKVGDFGIRPHLK